MITMAKIHPQSSSASDPCTTTMSSSASEGRETFTIWMKSLVCHTNGCTVFDSKGHIVYRVENYDSKGSSEVHLMDFHGDVLFTILRKKLQILGCWNGYRGNYTNSWRKKEKPCFQVKKYCSIFRRDHLVCQVTTAFNKYWMLAAACSSSSGPKKQGFKIVNLDGDIIAEVKQKQISSGMALGEDVLSLEVEPYVDHSLIVSLVVVYGLINRRL